MGFSSQSRDGTALGAQCSTEVPCTYFYVHSVLWRCLAHTSKILFPHCVSVQLKAYPLFAVLCLVAQSYLTLCDLMDCSPPGSSVRGDSPGKNTGVNCHALLQWIFPTQRLNSGLLHGRQILHHLSHQESPRILDWVAYPSPEDLPDPGIKSGSPALQADSFPAELPGKPHPPFSSAYMWPPQKSHPCVPHLRHPYTTVCHWNPLLL